MIRNKRMLVTFFMVLTALFAESAVAKLQKDARDCIKPRFTRFTPPHLSEVAPGSTVAFVANYSTSKATIKIKTKGIEIKDLRITDNKSFYHVEFELPEELVGTFARIHIKANAKIGPITCQHRDGWLLKITGDKPAPVAEATVDKADEPAAASDAQAQPVTNDAPEPASASATPAPVAEITDKAEPAPATE